MQSVVHIRIAGPEGWMAVGHQFAYVPLKSTSSRRVAVVGYAVVVDISKCETSRERPGAWFIVDRQDKPPMLPSFVSATSRP